MYLEYREIGSESVLEDQAFIQCVNEECCYNKHQQLDLNVNLRFAIVYFSLKV